MAIETQKTTPKSILKYILKCKSYIGPWLPQQPATILGRCQFGAPFQRFQIRSENPAVFIVGSLAKQMVNFRNGRFMQFNASSMVCMVVFFSG